MSKRAVEVAEWRSSLLRLRRYLLWYARRYYGRPVADFLKVRFQGASEIIRRSSARVLSTIVKGSGVTIIFASSKVLEEGPERLIKVRNLNGTVVELPLGVTAEEAYHITQVGCYGLKCTCTDALMTASKADRLFLEGLKRYGVKRVDVPTPVFTRFVICKHTLAAAAYALTLGVIPYDSKVFRETLKLGVLAAALRVRGLEGISKRKLMSSYVRILRLSKGLPP